MKRAYPQYNRKGVQPVYDALPESDKETLQRFLDHCAVTAGDHKVQNRRSELLQVRDVIEKPFGEWGNEEVNGYLSVLKRSNRKEWTRKCLLQTLQMFIKWHYPDWSSRFNNLNRLRQLKRNTQPNNSDRYNISTLPSPTELKDLVRSGRTTKQRLYLSMAAEAGLPPSVHVAIRWKHLKLDSPVRGVTTLHYFRNKNRAAFVFPFGKLVTDYLKEWRDSYEHGNPDSEDFVFCCPRSSTTPMTTQATGKWIRRAAQRAGIKRPVYQYLLRHRALSDNYYEFPEEVHRKLFGHVPGSLQTKTYSHVRSTEKALMLAVEKLHGVKNVGKRMSTEQEIARLRRQLHDVQAYIETIKPVLQRLSQIKSLSHD